MTYVNNQVLKRAKETWSGGDITKENYEAWFSHFSRVALDWAKELREQNLLETSVSIEAIAYSNMSFNKFKKEYLRLVI